MQRMSPLSLITLEILASGTGASVPFDMRPVTGLLVWADVGNLAYWDGCEWIPLNSAGFAARFGTNVPVMQVNSWAIISSPKLGVTGGQAFRKINAAELLFAFHAISVEESQPRSESSIDLPEAQDERADIDADVAAYIQEQAHGGTIPLQGREGR